jgi:hypothetical protein
VTFNSCEDCGDDPMAGVLILALVWVVPTLIYLARHQLSVGAALGRWLGVLQLISVVAAGGFSLSHFDLLPDPSDPVLRVSVGFGTAALAVSVAAVLIHRVWRQRRVQR